MKSILLHIHEDEGQEARMQAGLDLARAFEGHLSCLHVTAFTEYMTADPIFSAALPIAVTQALEARQQAIRDTTEARLKSEDVPWDYLHLDDDIATAIVRHSVFADIVVLSRALAAFERNDPLPIVAEVALSARSPVLAVPPELRRLDLDAPVVIAWNGSPEVSAAIRLSLPILKRAKSVHLVTVDKHAQDYPLDTAARYLSRHGIKAEIDARERGSSKVEQVLLAAVRDLKAGLLVMGAYGHSRVRERILGGVTRNLLGESPVPLLLAH